MLNYSLKFKHLRVERFIFRRHISSIQIENSINNLQASSLDYDDLFSPSSLSGIGHRLALSASKRPAFRFLYDKNQMVKEAAVLMLFCSVNRTPSILFTVRTQSLSSHPGEISFPGGKRDSSDNSLLATCLRETKEEIGIPENLIHVLGQYSPLPNRKGNLKVFPYVGILLRELEPHPQESKIENIQKILDYEPISLKINKDEVDGYFTIPVTNLLKKEIVTSWDSFRGSPLKIPRFRTPNYINGDIWGLTGFVLHGVLSTCFYERYQK